MTVYDLIQGAADAWHCIPSHQAALSAGGLGVWALDRPISLTERITSELPRIAGLYYLYRIQPKAGDAASRQPH
jgi:hypothetical protein